MSRKKKLSLVASICLVLALTSLLIINVKTYTPDSLALTTKKNTPDISVIEDKDGLRFQPNFGEPKETILFYQGALVTEDSYSYWATALAREGYAVYLLHTPFNMAILSPNKLAEITQKRELDSYIVGGHSLGGVISSRFVDQDLANPELKGLFFLASYPDKASDLSAFKQKVLSVTASQDLVLNQTNFQDAKKRLPAQTTFYDIAGGNHGGFGNYGKQNGDGQAQLTNQQQQDELVAIMLSWLADK